MNYALLLVIYRTSDSSYGWSNGMTQHVAYRWNGDLYCREDIVGALIAEFPWSAWAYVGHAWTDNTEGDLNSIAEMFGIDRDNPAELAEYGFPEWIGYYHPGFCRICKRWFDEEND